jgi:ABC-type transport system substrate-binding protein
MRYPENFLKTLSGVLLLISMNIAQANKLKDRKMSQSINIATRDLPENLDPMLLKAGHHVIIFQAIYQTLVKIDENGEVSPSIAKSWSFSKDFTEVIFKIDKIMFQNGEMLNVDDVVFSISRHVWPSSKSLDKKLIQDTIVGAKNSSEGETISGIKIRDKETISFNLIKPYRPFLHLLTTATFSIISKKAYSDQKFIGSGPFQVVSFGPKSLELSKFVKFNLATPKGNQISFLPFTDKLNALEMINAEVADLVFLGLDNSLDDILSEKIDVQRMENPVFLHLFLNTKKNKLFQNSSFREDLGKLVSGFVARTKNRSSTQDVQQYLIPRGLLPLPYYNQTIKELSLEDFKSKKYTSSNPLKILTTSNLLGTKFLAEFSSFLKAAGLKNVIDNKSRLDYNKDALNSEEYDLVFGAYAADFPDIDGIIAPILGTSGWTYGNYDTTAYSGRIQSIKHITDNNTRLMKYVEIIQDFEMQNYVIPLFRDHVRILYRRDLNVPKANYKYESEIWKIFWNI